MKLRLIFCLSILSFLTPSNAQNRITGDIDGVEYIIDIPQEETGKVMFIARGFRPDFFPVSAVYEVGTRFYQQMLEDGWTIASTAFRTNDWVVAEGAKDILDLQAFIESEIHPISKSIIYGETMGGGVAVWLAENKPETFDGVLCLGAHLFEAPGTEGADSGELAAVFNVAPQLPIVFLANGEEMRSSQTYIDNVSKSRYRPISYYVERSGHVNVNSAERLAAMADLFKLIDGKPVKTIQDGTIQLSPESKAARGESSIGGNVRLLRPLYGNIYTNFVPDDLKAIDIELSDTFAIHHKASTHKVTYAKAYSDVPYGEWVAFVDLEGYVQISRNYANAADTIGAQVGDPLLITK